MDAALLVMAFVFRDLLLAVAALLGGGVLALAIVFLVVDEFSPAEIRTD